MSIYSKRNELLIIIIDRIEMLEEEATEEVVAAVVFVQGVHGDGELADSFTLMEVRERFHLENGAFNVEHHGFDVASNFCARSGNLAESGVSFAIEVAHVIFPFLLKSTVLIWRNGDERASSVDDGWVGLGLSLVVKRVPCVEDILGVQSPTSNA